MPLPRTGLRFREIALAVGLGAVAAGGAGLMLEAFDDERPQAVMPVGPNEIEYGLKDFDQITTSGPQNVEVTRGDDFSVRSEGSPQALAQLEAVVENGRLEIRPREGAFRGNWGILEDATFHVTLPRIERITLAGSGDIRVDRIEGERFEGVIGGQGEIVIDELAVKEADLTVAGAGNMVVAGNAERTRINIGGVGEVRAAGLRSRNASISIGGAGDVALTVNEEAQISIAGVGDVDISGPGRCSVSRFGRGEVRCEGGGGDENN